MIIPLYPCFGEERLSRAQKPRGAYFVTLVTKNREHLFGRIVNDEIVLNEFGKIVEFTWNDLLNHNEDIGFGAFSIMPNHIHGIIQLYGKKERSTVGVGSQPTPVFQKAGLSDTKTLSHTESPEPNITIGAGFEPAPTKDKSLSEIIRQFKTFSARRINALRGTPNVPVWQRSFFDHIIGIDREYSQIEEYILDNPLKWSWDEENRQLD